MPRKYKKQLPTASPQDLQAGKPHSHAKYKKPVAMVYGEIDGVYFNQTFKSLKRAKEVAEQYSGILVLL